MAEQSKLDRLYALKAELEQLGCTVNITVYDDEKFLDDDPDWNEEGR